MLKANSDNHTIGSPVALWFPGRKMEGLASAAAAAAAAPLSERAREIAKSRDELLGLLRGLPESEYELSLTDLVEKGSVVGNSAVGCKTSPPEGESKRGSTAAVKERKKKRRSSRGSCGSSSSDGVLLNFYVPASLSRSLTASRPSRGLARRDADCDKRDREPTFGCWSALWERGRGKSRRQLFERR